MLYYGLFDKSKLLMKITNRNIYYDYVLEFFSIPGLDLEKL